MLTIVAIAAVVIAVFLLLIVGISFFLSPKPFNLSGTHVLITGGSSGIGRALALEVVKRGASVTLLARDEAKLVEVKVAAEKILKEGSRQKVFYVCADLSKDYGSVEKAIHEAEGKLGPVDVLVNSAGFSVSGQFEDIPIEDFKRLLNVNYLGGVYATRVVLPQMKRRKAGRILFISSQAGQIGIFGFSAYSGSKFALKGMAEALQMEVTPYNIRVCLAFPPDTDTPGYVEEMKTKPLETRLISETSGLFKPDDVAKTIVNDVVNGRFLSYMGIDGWMLSLLTSGMSPANSIFEAVQQLLLMGFLRIISLGYLNSFDQIVARCHQHTEEDTLRDKEQ